MGESERLSIEEIRELLQRVEIPNDVLLHRRALRDLLALYDEEHERAERAEAERDQLRAEVERLQADKVELGSVLRAFRDQLERGPEGDVLAGWIERLMERARSVWE